MNTLFISGGRLTTGLTSTKNHLNNGLGNGAIVFMLPEEGCYCLQSPDKKGQGNDVVEADMEDPFWEGEHKKEKEQTIYNQNFTSWRNKKIASNLDAERYIVTGFPESLTDNLAVGTAFSDGAEVAMQNGISNPPLKIIDLTTKYCNSGNDLPTYHCGELFNNGIPDRFGYMVSIAWKDENDRMQYNVIQEGNAFLTLADTSGVVSIWGGVKGVVYDNDATDPYWKDGVLHILPPGGGGNVDPQPPPTVPLAQFNNEPTANVAGKIAGLKHADEEDGAEPETFPDGFKIKDGVGEIPLAEYRFRATDSGDFAKRIGLLAGLKWKHEGNMPHGDENLYEPSVVNGVGYIPRPETYKFDPDWFIVSVTGDVTINKETLNEVINEVIDELNVDVNVIGVESVNGCGTQIFRTATLNTAAASPMFDSLIWGERSAEDPFSGVQWDGKLQ